MVSAAVLYTARKGPIPLSPTIVIRFIVTLNNYEPKCQRNSEWDSTKGLWPSWWER